MSKEILNILLKHKGKEKAIAAKEISRKLGFPLEESQWYCRREIKKTQMEEHLSLLSCNKGYFIADTDQEMAQYEEDMDRRIRQITERKETTRKFYEDMKKGDK